MSETHMKSPVMKKLLTLTGIAILTAVTASFAGDGKAVKEVVVPATCNFRDTEFQLDAFGAGAFYRQGRPGFGGGLGANFFFAKYFGIGVEEDLVGRNSTGSAGGTVWSTLGSLYLRYPICSWNLAPYAMVGGGAAYGSQTRGHGLGHVGAGLEYRVTPNIGLFTDGRFLYSSVEPKGSALVRTGLRFAF